MTTRWEVVAITADGARHSVGHTARQSRHGLLTVAQSRGAEMIALLGVTDADVVTFERDGAGRWSMKFGARGEIKFSGRTEKEASQ